jgi:hypothetical protein
MAAPKRNQSKHNESCREKIQTSQLLNRLQDHVFNGVEISATQMKAIEILLKKTLPDLQSVSHSGADGGELVVQIVRYGDNPASK